MLGCRGWRRGGDDEGADTRPSGYDASLFELAIGAMHGVGVDRDLADHFSYRRELVTRVQQTEADCMEDLIEELPVRGDPRARVEPEADERGFVRLDVLAR